jgi:Tol biopolymer transport system component
MENRRRIWRTGLVAADAVAARARGGEMRSRIRWAFAVASLVAVVATCAAMATTRGPNGLIVYSEETSPEHFKLVTIGPDGSGQRQITRGVSALNPDWSSDGRRIVFGLEKANAASIATMSADGTGIRNLTPKGFQGQPSFSPNGSRIVYERDIADGNNGVWLMHPDGSGLQRVTRNPFGCCDTDPNFSPDGRHITFVRIKREDELQALFSVGLDGKNLHQLTPYSWEVAIKHDWSPDGKLIVLTTNADFVRPTESANLVTIRPDGTGKRQLTHFTGGTKNAFAGSFSPDGKLIVFRLESGDSYSLATISRNGGIIRKLTTGKAKPRFIDWGTHP